MLNGLTFKCISLPSLAPLSQDELTIFLKKIDQSWALKCQKKRYCYVITEKINKILTNQNTSLKKDFNNWEASLVDLKCPKL